MQDQPDNASLLTAVADFLRREALPNLDPSLSYRARVAANVVDMVRRHLEAGDTAAEELARLQALLDRPGDTETLTLALCDAIAAGEVDLSTPGLESYLWFVTCNKVAVDQPRYSGYVRACERLDKDQLRSS